MSETLGLGPDLQTITFNEIPASRRDPGMVVEIRPNYGNIGLLRLPSIMLVISQMLTPGPGVANGNPGQKYPITADGQGEYLFGFGSVAATQIRAIRANNTTTPLFAVGVVDAPGAVRASVAITIGAASFPGGFSCIVRIGGILTPVVVPPGTTTAGLIAAIIAAINANLLLTVTASAIDANNLLLSAKNAGLCGNDINVRISDHWIKGQLPHVRAAGHGRAGRRPASLDASTAPLGQGAPIAPPPAAPASSRPRRHHAGRGHHGPVYQTGHATDAGVARYRPKVWMTRAEAGLDTVDDQAAWRARLTAAQADSMHYTVVGHTAGHGAAGAPAALWLPNTLVAVTDPIRGLDGVDQLIAGVTYLDGEDGARTILRVVDPEAYSLDLERIGSRRAGRSAPHHQHAVDATARRYR